jgi:aspartate aminotransferase
VQLAEGVERKAQFAQRVERISISPTLAVLTEAERYKARGLDVVDFGPGEPDFPTPEHIKRAAVRALEQNLTKYTPAAGIMPLRQATCEWHAAQFGSTYQPSECIITVGAKHAIFNAVQALIESGDEVLIPAPYWVSFPDIVKCAGGQPVVAQTEAANGFRLSASQLEAALTPRTRLVIVNSPCNPTGAVVDREEFAAVLDLCARRNIWLLTDECYSHFVYDPARPYSLAGIARARQRDRLITIGSLSKTFAMTGWRIGYALAPQPLVDAMVKLQSQSTSNPTSIAQYAALEALRGPMDSVATMLAEYARRRTRILAGVQDIPGVTCSAPEGAFYVFPNVEACPRSQSRELNGNIPALARHLLEQEYVAVVPGDAFGAPGYLRLSYATSLERIEEGLRRLARFLGSCP